MMLYLAAKRNTLLFHDIKNIHINNATFPADIVMDE